MNFKGKIKAHRAGEYDFTKELINLALSPFTFKTTMEMTIQKQSYIDYSLPEEEREMEIRYLPRWRAKYSEGKTYEEKLARNFKVMIAEYTRKANGIRKKIDFEGTQEKLMDVKNDRLHYIYQTLIEYGYHCYKDDFDKLPLKKIYKAIELREGVFARCDFRDTIKPFIDILPRINRDKQKLLDQYVPLIEEAINDVLLRVDLERTDEDIIAYVAVGVRNNVQRAVTNLLESKVHQIDGKRYYLTIKQIRERGFNKTKANSILKVDFTKLSSKQYLFYDTLCRRIEDECKALNTKPFTFNENGDPIKINQAYFAHKMGINHDTFRQRLRRLNKL